MPPPTSVFTHRARFLQVDVRTDGPGRITVECTIQNTGPSAWSRPDSLEPSPVRLGFLVYDAQTDRLVFDGDRIALEGDCGPGQTLKATAEIPLPPEEGRYRIILSPVEEQVAWFHERGSEFVVVEARSTPQGVRVEKAQTMSALRWRVRGFRRTLGRSFWYPLRTLLRHRSLIASMVRRDMLGRYRGSLGGALWTFGQPLLLMAAYYFVFAVVLRVRFGEEQGSAGFFLYFLCGLLPWMAISEALGRAATTVLDHGNFVKRVVFPLEILPVNLTLAGLATEAFGLLIFLGALLALGRGVPWTALWFPAVFLPQILLTLGLCWFLAALGVFVRDTGQIMGFLLTVWFFLTPICYPASALPADWLWLLESNPMYAIVSAYRAVLIEGAAPDGAALARLWAVSLGFFFLGHAWFYRGKKSFADLI